MHHINKLYNNAKQNTYHYINKSDKIRKCFIDSLLIFASVIIFGKESHHFKTKLCQDQNKEEVPKFTNWNVRPTTGMTADCSGNKAALSKTNGRPQDSVSGITDCWNVLWAGSCCQDGTNICLLLGHPGWTAF